MKIYILTTLLVVSVAISYGIFIYSFTPDTEFIHKEIKIDNQPVQKEYVYASGSGGVRKEKYSVSIRSGSGGSGITVSERRYNGDGTYAIVYRDVYSGVGPIK